MGGTELAKPSPSTSSLSSPQDKPSSNQISIGEPAPAHKASLSSPSYPGRPVGGAWESSTPSLSPSLQACQAPLGLSLPLHAGSSCLGPNTLPTQTLSGPPSPLLPDLALAAPACCGATDVILLVTIPISVFLLLQPLEQKLVGEAPQRGSWRSCWLHLTLQVDVTG